MKKDILRKLWIVLLAVLPASMAVQTNAFAAEITCASEEMITAEEGETALPEETTPAEEEEEETALPEETTPAEEEETALPEETIPAEEEEETALPEETIPAEGEETALPEETTPVEEEETALPEETAPVEEEEETALSEEMSPAEEEETVLTEEDLAVSDQTEIRAEAETGTSGEEKQTLSEEIAEFLKSGIDEQLSDRIHYITLNDRYAASDSILIESNGHYGLVDASHPSSDPDERISGYTADVDNVIDYLHLAGVLHLDFVLGTHSHSDHIGGMKFLAAALNTEGNYWIDSNTVYYYKQQHYNALEEGDWEWQNSRMFRQAIEAMTSRGAILVETGTHSAESLEKANAVFVKGEGSKVSDSIEFSLGNLAISLFNLYHNSSENENLNSIVTAVRKDDSTTLLMGDLEMEGGYERAVANTVAAKYGNADVIKVGHHGYEECTSSDMLRTLDPSYIVTTSNRTGSFYDDEPPYNYFLANRGITAYRAAQATYALVEVLSGEDILFYTYDKNGELTKEPVEWKARMTSGWKKWNRDDGTYDYIYIRADGSAATGWNYLTRNGKTSWYLFDQDGINLRGFQKVGDKTYYLNTKGEMQTGWRLVSGKWYYMDRGGVMQTGWQQVGGKWYYMNSSGVMQASWQEIDGKWYYLGNSGAMQTGWKLVYGKWYYLDRGGVMQTGWQQVNGKWYYMDETGVMQASWQLIDGKWYYLGNSGAMQTGWQMVNGKWYYMDRGGVMQTGWQEIDGKRYYMNDSGAMLTGWQQIEGEWYYFEAGGAMARSRWVGNYYLTESGEMAIDSWIGDYYVGSDGLWIPGYKAAN